MAVSYITLQVPWPFFLLLFLLISLLSLSFFLNLALEPQPFLLLFVLP